MIYILHRIEGNKRGKKTKVFAFCACMSACIQNTLHTNIFYNKIREVLLTSIVLGSVNGQVVGGVTVAFQPTTHSVFSLSNFSWLWFFTLVRWPKSSIWVWPLIVLPELGSCYFPFSYDGMVILRDTLKPSTVRLLCVTSIMYSCPVSS